MIFLSTLLLSLLITIALIPFCSRMAMRLKALDLPNERKVHCTPIPRSGGLAMAVGVFVPLLALNFSSRFALAYGAGALVLVIFGLVDDFRDLPPRAKLAGQLLAALIAIFLGGVQITSLGALLPEGTQLAPWLSIPLTLLVMVGVTNAINLADGLDGLAGGITLLIFCCIGFLAYLEGDTVIGLIALSLAGAIFGFLRFNTHPATVFMGDAGSQLLGFSAIILSLSLTQEDKALSPLLPLLLVGFPVLDTLTVMCTRILKGRSPFAADKNHFHHNLMGIGLRHSESVLVIYVIQTILVAAALLLRFYSDWLLLGGYLAFSTVVLGSFTVAGRRGWQLGRLACLDGVIARLTRLRDQGTVIRVAFPLFENVIPLLLIFTCLLPGRVPGYLSLSSVALVTLIVVLGWLDRDRLAPLLRVTLYLLIPYAVYLSDRYPSPWLGGEGTKLYNVSFGVLAVLIILVSKFSRRLGGFKSTPLDFLILSVVLIGPNLPDQWIRDNHIGLVAVKILVLYFCFEVLLAELRGRLRRVALGTVLSLLVLAGKWLLQ